MTTATESKRTRQVYPSAQVAHIWANERQASARNSNHSMFFDGASIYSYGHHFEMARHVRNAEGAHAVLVTTLSYSVTTAKHLSYVRRSIPSYIQEFHVPLSQRFVATPEVYMLDYVARFDELLDKAKKARENKVWHLNSARELAEEANKFAEFYTLEDRINLPADFAAQLEQAEERNAERNRLRDEKRARDNAAREERAKRNLAAWLNNLPGEGGTASDLYYLPCAYFRLRSDGETIETSKGAQFPREHGERAFRLLALLRAEGKTYQRNGHTIHVGHFQIDSLNEEGIVRAGCHTVEWSEIERFARVMNWTV